MLLLSYLVLINSHENLRGRGGGGGAIIRPLKITLLSYRSKHKGSEVVMVTSQTC